jgi:hypothetical protein
MRTRTGHPRQRYGGEASLYRTMAPPRLSEQRMVALDAAMLGAATAVTAVEAIWANIEGDISAFAGGINSETAEYRSWAICLIPA